MIQEHPLTELWITLAQAFLPPLRAGVQDAFRADLGEDLAALAAAAELTVQAEIEAFRGAVAPLAGEALLVHYSGLFLAPPIEAHLNIAWLLDGSLNGPTQDAVEAAFAAHGIARKPTLADFPDHLAAQLEFLALLGAEDAEEQAAYAQRFLLPATQRLADEIAAAAGNSPYLHLARIAAVALTRLAAVGGEAPAEERRPRRPPDPGKGVWRACARCGKPFARERELAIVAKALAASGLSDEHLSVCPACRNPMTA